VFAQVRSIVIGSSWGCRSPSQSGPNLVKHRWFMGTSFRDREKSVSSFYIWFSLILSTSINDTPQMLEGYEFKALAPPYVQCQLSSFRSRVFCYWPTLWNIPVKIVQRTFPRALVDFGSRAALDALCHFLWDTKGVTCRMPYEVKDDDFWSGDNVQVPRGLE
jgi:hypothetical protein